MMARSVNSAVEWQAEPKCPLFSYSSGAEFVANANLAVSMGGGWSNLWRSSAPDRWSWFIGKKFAFFRRKTPLLRLERRLSSRAQSPLFRGSCDELYVTAMFYFAS